MKKVYTLIVLIMFMFCLSSCVNDSSKDKLKVITPSGAPTLGISYAIKDDKIFDTTIVAGPDALAAAFSNKEYDIIVAPVNLGVKFYNSLNKFDYVYYKTIIGGCFYLASIEKIETFQELNNTEITVFGKNSTPDVVVRSLINYYGLNVKINYVNDVSEANAMLIGNKANIIVSAEPAISKINQNNKYHTFDLTEEWKKISNTKFNIPQAGIFVKKNKIKETNVRRALKQIDESLNLASENPKLLAEVSIQIDESLNKIGVDILTHAIPRCHYIYNEYDSSEITFYLTQIISLNLGQLIGEKIPNEDFFA